MAAAVARIGCRNEAIYGVDGMLGADLDAVQAVAAALLEIQAIGGEVLALRVVAPPAGEWTALKEDAGANPRPIVRRKTHDVEDKSTRRIEVSLGQSGLLIYNLS